LSGGIFSNENLKKLYDSTLGYQMLIDAVFQVRCIWMRNVCLQIMDITHKATVYHQRGNQILHIMICTTLLVLF